MLPQIEYRFAIVLFLAAKTAEGAENGVFFQIKENIFFSFGGESLLWSGTGSLLSCSVLCMRQASCRSVNFLENAGLCLISSRRSANKFSNWAAFRVGWLFLFKKGISR